MSDFDFEELDQAVNNVLGDKTARAEAGRMSGAAPISPERATIHTDELASFAPNTPSSTENMASQGSEALPAKPLVAPRSSINRKPQPTGSRPVVDIMTPPSKRVMRESPVLQPTHSVEEAVDTEPISVPKRVPTEDAALRWPPKPAMNAEQDTKPVAESLAEVSSKEDTKVAESPHTTDENSFERFESLSRSGFDFDKPAETEVITDKPVHASKEEVPLVIEDTAEATPAKESDIPATAQQSPFLSDAKVEKRPLGSFSSYEPEAEKTEAKDDTSALSAETDKKPVANHDTVAEPPKDAEVSRIETGVSSLPEGSKLTAEPALKQPSVKLDHLLTDGHEHEHAHLETGRSSTSTSTLDAIPQQYKVTAASSGDDATHQIFDTKEYHHAPMSGHDAQPHRGSSTFLIASVVLLVLAIAAAAAIYFYGEQLGL